MAYLADTDLCPEDADLIKKKKGFISILVTEAQRDEIMWPRAAENWCSSSLPL